MISARVPSSGVPTSAPTERSAPSVVVLAYLLAVVGAQLLLGSGPSRLGLAANAVLVMGMMNEVLAGGRLDEEHDRRAVGSSPAMEAVAVLALVPLLSLVSAAVPVAEPVPRRWAIVTVAMLLAVILVARPAPVRSLATMLSPASSVVPMALGGAVLGFGASALLGSPAAVSAADGAGAVLATVVVLLMAGALWELAFRGMLQLTLARAFATSGVVSSAVVSAAAAAGSGRLGYAAVLGLTGLVSGTVVHRTGRLAGVVAAQGLFNVMLFVVAPAVLP